MEIDNRATELELKSKSKYKHCGHFETWQSALRAQFGSKRSLKTLKISSATE